jgi:hypothetical protein
MISVGAFSSEIQNFGPGLPMTRGDFALAIAELTGMHPPAEITSRTNRTQKPTQETMESPFADVSTLHPYYQQIVEVERRGLIKGVGTGRFYPDGKVTRAQAATLLIRALGFEGLAPNPTYSIFGYLDAKEIPDWAVDSVLVATQIGLIAGADGYFYPQESLSRAEAALLLDRFREYLQRDLKYEYRERIINRR